MMKLACALSAVLVGAASVSASPRPTPGDDWRSQTWDAIVVGAGTAGIIVADRLSEAGLKTLLLEQGGPSYGITGGTEGPGWLHGTGLSRVDVPGLYSTIFAGHSPLLCEPHIVRAFQGCTMGGNSAINAGLYFQPPASDWDDYHPAGWRSADVRPAVARLLARQPPVTAYSSDGRFYAQSGYDAVRDWIVGAAGFANVSMADEPDRKDRVFGRPVYDYIDGQRGGPVRTYLQSALARPNFRLQMGVRVRYVTQHRGKASGVVVEEKEKGKGNGDGNAPKTTTITTIRLTPGARGRVVLSAGAILSPQLLMYSGIGPRDTLARLAARAHTPYVNESSWVVQPAVGEGLFDNPNTFIELSGPDIASYRYDYGDALTPDRAMYLSSRSGPYAFASQTSVFWAYVPHGDGSRTGVQGTVSSSGYADFTANNTITLNVYGTSGVLSSGRVELSDDGNFTAGPGGGIYYSHPRDADAIASFIHSIFQALPASSPASPAPEGLTPLNIARNSTLEQIRHYITTPSPYAVGSVQHWSSSCRIGACVDVNAKVIGSDNIHVIDASVLAPMTVNPQFAVMVAGELGAERVLRPIKV
ncbi:Cellobiose dehydrogenase (acceptor) [Purpureocillium takamizusanense]|uniref:Cellobiose dehydrogenase (Acceptor) n=1 Tax=Purpureocillium takamizusanense TaxID=2060973 RepID=A0A9Q8QLK4_9HYPO|nr:Cellobiose dehydrogenase (acceptor) [Purpureocillium takamizusanense]UNI22258.1 Cellobiose dehydrogenase (acceptor) [Purpureocillium takamizusanense]